MSEKAIQDFYPDDIAVCYGCGRHNPTGLAIKTYWDGAEGVCRYRPSDDHLAYPGLVYGGLIACLVDCHSIGTAAAAAHDAEGKTLGVDPVILFFTARLEVDYIAPTPVGAELLLTARIEETTPRKSVVSCTVHADDVLSAKGRVVAVKMRE
ncbi:MAG: PaaI family thioesterase [Deltaproteobacteria bacterium]|nr:PaaI family thioesterase [Candidatus Zymogenaceae bacterium]